MAHDLCSSFLSKIEDQIGRVEHLMTLIPDYKLDWTPPIPKGFSISVLVGHLMECFAGFCAVLYAANPDRLIHFLDLKKATANQRYSPVEARIRFGVYRDHIREGFALLQDNDLSRLISTVFVPDGEPLLSLFLINFEHLASHKYQLFIYLRLLELNVSSKDLYHFSGQ